MSPKTWKKGMEKLEIGDHPNFGIIKFDQYTQESPGDPRRLAVNQTPVNDNQLTSG